MSPAQPGMIALALILAEILAFRLWSTSSISVSRFLFIVSRLETVLPFSLYINNKLTEPFQRYHYSNPVYQSKRHNNQYARISSSRPGRGWLRRCSIDLERAPSIRLW